MNWTLVEERAMRARFLPRGAAEAKDEDDIDSGGPGRPCWRCNPGLQPNFGAQARSMGTSVKSAIARLGDGVPVCSRLGCWRPREKMKNTSDMVCEYCCGECARRDGARGKDKWAECGTAGCRGARQISGVVQFCHSNCAQDRAAASAGKRGRAQRRG